MGIQIEFNPDLALRDISNYHKGHRQLEECLPSTLEQGKIYDFLKEGQRNYWLEGEIPLCETDGCGNLSKPFAAINIIESTHFYDSKKGEIYTKGKYKVVDVFNPDEDTIHFECCTKIAPAIPSNY